MQPARLPSRDEKPSFRGQRSPGLSEDEQPLPGGGPLSAIIPRPETPCRSTRYEALPVEVQTDQPRRGRPPLGHRCLRAARRTDGGEEAAVGRGLPEVAEHHRPGALGRRQVGHLRPAADERADDRDQAGAAPAEPRDQRGRGRCRTRPAASSRRTRSGSPTRSTPEAPRGRGPRRGAPAPGETPARPSPTPPATPPVAPPPHRRHRRTTPPAPAHAATGAARRARCRNTADAAAPRRAAEPRDRRRCGRGRTSARSPSRRRPRTSS